MKRKELGEINFQTTTREHKNSISFETAENISIQSEYFKKDVENLSHTNYLSGIEPYLGGPY
ncbi:MAG: hypothetical protein ACKO7P_08725, partial [Bacteroidota bacterium]